MSNHGKPFRYRCAECGGDMLLFDIQCYWDDDEQCWSPDNFTGEQPWCEDCEQQVNYDTIDIEDDDE